MNASSKEIGYENGYNISIGGEAFAMSDVQIAKRTLTMVETKNQNR